MRTIRALRHAIGMLKPGSEIGLGVLRDGNEKSLRVAIGDRDAARAGPELSRYGFEVAPLTAELAERFGYENVGGVVVRALAPNSPAAEAGLRTGDWIVGANRAALAEAKDRAAAIARSGQTGSLLLKVRSGRAVRYLVLRSRR